MVTIVEVRVDESEQIMMSAGVRLRPGMGGTCA
jgi:hypothetical protein